MAAEDKAPTVAQVIKVLQTMPQDLRCYFRPKYSGPLDYFQEVPLKLSGISEMHPDKGEKKVTFLC